LIILKDSTKPLLPPPPPPKPQTAEQTSISLQEIPYPIAFAGVIATLSAALSFGTFALREDKESREIQQEQANQPSDSSSSTPAPLSGTTTAESVSSSNFDVSIPYDAAALLAYSEWRNRHNKGDFHTSKFEKFKEKYLAATVANVSSKRKAREQGGDPTIVELDENADQ
jgi:hypothetical protein